MQEKADFMEEFPNYVIINDGRIRSLRDGRYLRPRVNNRGILTVQLIDAKGVQRTRSVAVLVAQTFVTKYTPESDTVVHRDGNKSNCREDNLAWSNRATAIRVHRMKKESERF